VTTGAVEAAAEDVSERLDSLPFLPFHWRMTGLLGFGTFFDSFDSSSMSTAITMMVASLDLSYGARGILLGAAALGQFLGAILFGFVGERIGRKWAFVLSVGIFGLCSIAVASATGFNQIWWARAIQGFGIGGATPVAAALFTEFVRGSRRGLFTLMYETMYVWGLFFSPIIALGCLSWFGPEVGWRVLFLIGGLPLVGAILGAFKLPESPRWLASVGRAAEAEVTVAKMEDEARRLNRPSFPAKRPKIDIEPTNFFELFQGIYLRRTFVVWSMTFGSYFIANGFLSWAPTLYMKIGGLPASRAIMLQIVNVALVLVLTYVMALTVDSVGRVKWFVIGFAISAVGSILGVIVTGPLGIHTWPALLACGLIMQTAATAGSTMIGLYLPEMYPTRMRAWGTSAGQAFNRAAAFVAPVTIGWIMAETEAVTLVFAVFLVVAIYALIVILTLGEETKRRTLEEISP
jgi:putative MFS transporter